MKVLNYILLTALFLLIGNSISSSVSLLCLLLLVGTNLIVVKKGKIKVPLYFYLTLAIYLIFLTIGLFYGHREPQIDIKFQLFGFLFYLFLFSLKIFLSRRHRGTGVLFRFPLITLVIPFFIKYDPK